MNLDVIYGDTDSIMINTNCTDIDQVFKLGNKIKSEVNKLYRLLEIDIDGVYKSMLLLKKKKYAALNVQKVGDKYVTSQELKGLDIVRRDWCELAKEAGNYIVSQILCGESREAIVENIHTKLIDVGEKVKEGKIPVELYQITKSLTKNPEDYPDKKSLPHVQVALRINSKGGKRLKAGDAVYYVICEDGSTLPASQRAYHPEELAKSDSLKIDTKYYLAQQVHPVVARLCDPIDGTDAAHIAECLGLDPSGYQHHHRNHDDEDNAMLGGGRLSEEERFKDCDRFKFRCPNSSCNRETIIDSVFTGSGSVIDCSLARCPNNQCESVPADFVRMLQNHISQLIRAHIKKYYESWLSCDDSTCNHRTRRLPLTFQRGQPVCQACNRGILRPEYTDTALYDQLCFYQYIFDIDKAISSLDEKDRAFAKMKSKDVLVSYRTLKQHVERRIKQSAYSQVDLNRLFEGLAVYKQSSQ